MHADSATKFLMIAALVVDDQRKEATDSAVAGGVRGSAPRGPTPVRGHGFIALTILLTLALLYLAFDWNWFRPAVEHYLSSKSSRSVSIDDLDVSHAWTLEPTVRLRGIRIQNAAWADPRPFIVAGEAIITVRLPSLLRRRPIITRLVLIDADVDLERQADGLRNWRLTKPEDRGPGVVKIFALEAIRTQIQFIHRGIDLDLKIGASAGKPPGTTLFEGTYQGATFSGDLTTGNEVTFQGTQRMFPVRAHMVTGGTDLVLDGRAADVFDRMDIDARATLHGPSLAEIGLFIRKDLPDTAPYRVTTHLAKEGNRFSFSDGHVKIGKTDAEGTLTIDRTAKPVVVRATVRSQATRVEDLTWTKRNDRGTTATRANTGPATTGAGDPGPPTARTSASPLFRAIHGLDAELHLEINRLTMASLPDAAHLTLVATATDDALTIAPVALSLAGGTASGSIKADGRGIEPKVQAHGDARGMRLDKLLHGQPNGITGALDAHFNLTAHGASLATLARSTSGTVSGAIHTGSMPRKLEAELTLSGTHYLRALFDSSDLVAIQCAAVDIEFQNGEGRARKLVLETAITRVVGTGTIELPSRTIDLQLTPQGDRGFMELRKSIQVRGVLGKLDTSLIDAMRQSPERCDRRSWPVQPPSSVAGVDQEAGCNAGSCP